MRRCRPIGYGPARVGQVAGYGPGIGPAGVGPAGYGPGGPGRVAPVQRVIHPTQYRVRTRTTRYPVEHIFPVHTKTVHNHVREHCCRPVFTNSHQDCCYDVNINCGPRRGGRVW